MIFDNIENTSQYYALGEKIKKGFDFLTKNDLKNLKDGKYRIEDEEIYANIQSLKTKSKEEKRFEAHRKYIDIQYVIKGSETMGYGLLKDFCNVVEEYDKNKDIVFLDGNKFNYINVSENNFVIFYPNDVHAPMLYDKEASDIKKVIVKIAL